MAQSLAEQMNERDRVPDTDRTKRGAALSSVLLPLVAIGEIIGKGKGDITRAAGEAVTGGLAQARENQAQQAEQARMDAYRRQLGEAGLPEYVTQAPDIGEGLSIYKALQQPQGKDVIPFSEEVLAGIEDPMERERAKALGAGGYRAPREADPLVALMRSLQIGELQDKPGQRQTKQEGDLAKRYGDASKDFVKVRDAYKRVVASGKQPTAAGDLAMIFNYMKILDPGSVVRESEFKTAALAGGYGERIKAAVAQTVEGTRLSPAMRADFLDRAQKLYNEQLSTQQDLKKTYEAEAKRRRIDPTGVTFSVVVDEPSQQPPQGNEFDRIMEQYGN